MLSNLQSSQAWTRYSHLSTRNEQRSQWIHTTQKLHCQKERTLFWTRDKERHFLSPRKLHPLFSLEHLNIVSLKNIFFCHPENTGFQTLPKNALFISFAHFLLFLGGSNNDSLAQNQRVYASFSPKKILLANLKNTNFWMVSKTIKDGRCSHVLYMFTCKNTYYGRLSARGLAHSATWSEIFRLF